MDVGTHTMIIIMIPESHKIQEIYTSSTSQLSAGVAIDCVCTSKPT